LSWFAGWDETANQKLSFQDEPRRVGFPFEMETIMKCKRILAAVFKGPPKARCRRGLILASALASCAAWGLQWRPLAVEELTEHADVVVQARVTDRQCQRDEAGRIFTRVQLTVIEVWKGNLAGTDLAVVHSGGTWAGETAALEGQVEYPPGQEVVAFLARNPKGMYVTVGLAQGKFQVIRTEKASQPLVRNPFHGLGVEPDLLSQVRAGPEALALSELKRRVQTVIR